jgi:pimeloyl-ACP methyl ester carboxylesterase
VTGFQSTRPLFPYHAPVLVALQVVVWSIVGLAVLVTAAFLAGRWFFVERDPDEIHFARTEDGWRIALTRYRAEPAAAAQRPGAEPVIICHGIAANRYGVDLTDELSLARALSRSGFDAWIVELRGRGLSTQPRLFGAHRFTWSFDEYVEKDAPAAIAAVRAATGKERVHWVGHSLGAAVGYALLSDPAQAACAASFVAIGGPATYRFQQKYLFHWPLRNLRFVKHAFLMRLISPLAGYWRPKLLHHPENISGEVIRRFLVNASANFAPDELLQYADWIAHDVFRSIDQRRDYRAELARLTTPTLFIAGNKDLIAPPPSVKDAYELAGSADKRFVVASRGQALDANYGHMDLILGNGAPKDIYPLVAEWLEAHSARGGA